MQVQMQRVKAGFSLFKRLYCDLGGGEEDKRGV
jgi:hypothetical protein